MVFFSKIVDAINKLYPFKAKNKDSRSSRFAELSKDIKQSVSLKENNIDEIIALCDEGLDIVSDRMVLIDRLKVIEEKLEEVESYNNLNDDEVEDLKEMLSRYLSLSRDSNALKYQVTSFDKSLTKMENLASEAPKAINEIKYAEERQKIFKKDISYLAGEKMVLEHDNERLQNAIDFVYKFTIAMVMFFSGTTVLMVFLYIFQNVQTMLIMAVMLVLIIVVTALLYSLRIRLKHELALNYKKQKRAVELLNKKTVVYAHFTNFLNYEYKKFKVRNADMLSNNLTDYNHYKHLTKRLDSLRSSLYNVEQSLEFFLKEKGIKTNFSNMEKFANNINIEDKQYYYRQTSREKSLIDSTLKKLDARHAQIWDILAKFNNADKTAEKHIDKIIKSYLEKSSEILAKYNEDDLSELTLPITDANLEALNKLEATFEDNEREDI